MNEKKKLIVDIKGMHCSSCEILIERNLKKLPGVREVKVKAANEEAEISCDNVVTLEELQAAVKSDGYTLSLKKGSKIQNGSNLIKNDERRFIEIGAAFIIILAGYLLFKQFDLLPNNFGITDNMSFAFVFMLGLFAATSACLAVSGGLLLAVSARYNEQHTDLTQAQKFEPHVYFNSGRIISYTLFGALIGLVGSAFTLSPAITGWITVISSMLMIVIGLQLLQIFPFLNKIHLKMPKFVAHKIYDASEESKVTKNGAFFFGASTFFLPCGFTIALQLYVLGKGDPVTGALTMLAFSLGTLPSLLSIGALTSLTKGSFHRHIITLSAALVIFLGFFNIQNGFALTGISFASSPTQLLTQDSVDLAASSQEIIQVDENVKIIDGKQIVEMKVIGLEYSPHRFTVVQGVPVEWVIDGTQAQGCAQVITVPKLGITEYLPSDKPKTIRFVPQEIGTIPFYCTMGMTTPNAAFEVIPNTVGIKAASIAETTPNAAKLEECDPEIATCGVQKLTMEISKERGFYPNTFTVKKNIPVELEIDTKLQLGGCMSTLVIPDYNIAHLLSIGKTKVKFTPTKEGTVPFTCSMGSRMGQFIVEG